MHILLSVLLLSLYIANSHSFLVPFDRSNLAFADYLDADNSIYDDTQTNDRMKRGRLLNLVGPNNRFTEPYRLVMIRKKFKAT